MQISLATVIQRRNISDWYARCTMQLKIPVPQEEKRKLPKIVELFSYPEFNSERNQLEPRTFDFTHILTNIRCQILSRGFDYCKKEHFEELCKDKPDILSIALVFDKINMQNAFTAMCMFNYSVQRWMEQKGYTETTTFIKLIRNWHDACNRRGLSADTHVRYLTDMYSFLVQGINFNGVPFQFPDRYIRGMTWQTFEALLQSISTCIQLYYMSRNFTYNARAVSTLANESFFSDLVCYDKESHGYPEGVNVCKVLGHVVLINFFKHKRNKNISFLQQSKENMKLSWPKTICAGTSESLLTIMMACTLGPAYNEHFDAKEFTRCKRVLIVTELALTRILLVVQSSYQCLILAYLMSTNH